MINALSMQILDPRDTRELLELRYRSDADDLQIPPLAQAIGI